MPKITIKRVTLPESKKQAWMVLDRSSDAPDHVTAGVNGGYCNIWSASVGYTDEAGVWRTPPAAVVETWTEPTGHGFEQTRLAVIEW